VAATQRGLSSLGARPLPRGRSTIDIDAGFPYFLGMRVTVGAGQISKQLAFDATIAARTMLARTELGIGGRMKLIDENPFSAAVFTSAWWGSKLFDDSKRNGATWDIGVAASLTALAQVTITGRAYAELWTDRHCPTVDPTAPNGFSGTEPAQVCVDVKSGHTTVEERTKLQKLFGTVDINKLTERDEGARFLLSLIAEIAVQQQWNLFFLFEAAPFDQAERALFTGVFSSPMPVNDVQVYGRMGLTYKF
jgi:hypothetical protein